MVIRGRMYKDIRNLHFVSVLRIRILRTGCNSTTWFAKRITASVYVYSRYQGYQVRSRIR